MHLRRLLNQKAENGEFDLFEFMSESISGRDSSL